MTLQIILKDEGRQHLEIQVIPEIAVQSVNVIAR